MLHRESDRHVDSAPVDRDVRRSPEVSGGTRKPGPPAPEGDAFALRRPFRSARVLALLPLVRFACLRIVLSLRAVASNDGFSLSGRCVRAVGRQETRKARDVVGVAVLKY